MHDPESWLALCAAAVVVLGPAALIYLRFRREIRAAWDRLQRGAGQVIETADGPVEFAAFGEGPAAVVAHGIFGGYDQGLVIAHRMVGEEFRAIVPSRFGYLHTPLPDGASPSRQADAYAALLDALGIEKAAVIGTSAGGTSAIQFALRHPNRCSALALCSSSAPGRAYADLPPQGLAGMVFRSDLLFWLMTTVIRPGLRSIMGVPEKFKLTPEFEADLAEVTAAMLPCRPRSAGALFDLFGSNPEIDTGYPLETIAVPVLIVSALDDPLTSYQHAQATAERIPGAKLVAVESGGAMLLGHREQIRAELTAFLKENA